MGFEIELHHGAYRYRFLVNQGKPLKGFELFTLTGGDKKVMLQSNRPMLLARGLKQPIYWKVVEGEVRDLKARDKVARSIERYLKEQEEVKLPAGAVKKEMSGPFVFAKRRKNQYGRKL